jgi:hypothetical protein
VCKKERLGFMADKLVNFPLTVLFRPMACVWLLQEPAKQAGLAVHKRQSMRPTDRLVDAWETRDEFLSLNTTVDLTKFLQRTGCFTLWSDYFRDLREWQDLIGKLLVTNPQHWPKLSQVFDRRKVKLILREDKPHCGFNWSSGKPQAYLWAGFTLRAIVATIQVDHLRDAKFRFCMKADCGKPYEVTAGYRKLYCDQACAHHASVRRNRRKRQLQRAGTQ